MEVQLLSRFFLCFLITNCRHFRVPVNNFVSGSMSSIQTITVCGRPFPPHSMKCMRAIGLLCVEFSLQMTKPTRSADPDGGQERQLTRFLFFDFASGPLLDGQASAIMRTPRWIPPIPRKTNHRTTSPDRRTGTTGRHSVLRVWKHMVAKSCPVVEVCTSAAMECMNLLIDKGQRGFGCTGKPVEGTSVWL